MPAVAVAEARRDRETTRRRDFGYDSFDVSLTTRIILWGTTGVAFNRNGLQILSGTFVAVPVASAMKARALRTPSRLLVARLAKPPRPGARGARGHPDR
jgi:hypothetical protein